MKTSGNVRNDMKIKDPGQGEGKGREGGKGERKGANPESCSKLFP